MNASASESKLANTVFSSVSFELNIVVSSESISVAKTRSAFNGPEFFEASRFCLTSSETVNEVIVSNLVFSNLNPVPISPNIKIRLTLSYNNPDNFPDFSDSFSLETAVSVRR